MEQNTTGRERALAAAVVDVLQRLRAVQRERDIYCEVVHVAVHRLHEQQQRIRQQDGTIHRLLAERRRETRMAA